MQKYKKQLNKFERKNIEMAKKCSEELFLEYKNLYNLNIEMDC